MHGPTSVSLLTKTENTGGNIQTRAQRYKPPVFKYVDPSVESVGPGCAEGTRLLLWSKAVTCNSFRQDAADRQHLWMLPFLCCSLVSRDPLRYRFILHDLSLLTNRESCYDNSKPLICHDMCQKWWLPKSYKIIIKNYEIMLYSTVKVI